MRVTVPGAAPQQPIPPIPQALRDAPENSWTRLNTNRFIDAWPPEVLDFANTKAIIQAWGSMAWDSRRGDLIFWGGGHANTPGNAVYRWRSASGEWERASLPSAIVADPLVTARYETVDGPLHSPISMHTYDGNTYLPIADRLLVFGGPQYQIGGGGPDIWDGNIRRMTGPYLWDPNKADPWAAGGLPGTHILSDAYPANAFPGRGDVGEPRLPAHRRAAGRERGLRRDLRRLRRGERQGRGLPGRRGAVALHHPRPDRSEPGHLRAGRLLGHSGSDPTGPGPTTRRDASGSTCAGATCGSSCWWRAARRGARSSTGGWSSRTRPTVPTCPSGTTPPGPARATAISLDYDPKRDRFLLWEGMNEVWSLEPPLDLANGQWLVTRLPQDPLAPDYPDRIAEGVISGGGALTFTGINGNWEYIPEWDVFLGVYHPVNGDIWAYKPEGWDPPAAP